MIIPFESLEKETLTAVIEDWLSRQTQESALDMAEHSAAVQQVRDALKHSRLVLTWDDESQTLNLLNPEQI
ncbi:MAG: YheU family protein [Reinekea sp.]